MTDQDQASTTEYWFPIVHAAMPHGTNPLISKSVATAVSMQVEFGDCRVEGERDALKARVDRLTTALSNLIHYINSGSTIPMSTQLRAVLTDATAVLSASD